MNDESISGLFNNNYSGRSEGVIELSCKDSDGSTLHGSAIKLAEGHYEVLIKEKEVIIHCTKDADGNLSCQLNRNGNPEWVNRISEELSKNIEK